MSLDSLFVFVEEWRKFIIKNVEERGEKCGIFVIFALIFYFETN